MDESSQVLDMMMSQFKDIGTKMDKMSENFSELKGIVQLVQGRCGAKQLGCIATAQSNGNAGNGKKDTTVDRLWKIIYVMSGMIVGLITGRFDLVQKLVNSGG